MLNPVSEKDSGVNHTTNEDGVVPVPHLIYSPSAITATNISVSYGSTIALDNFSCDIKRGESVVLIGPNGAGKTTFIESIVGLLGSHQGQLHVFEQDIKLKDNKLSHRIGVQLQETSLFPRLYVSEYIDFFASLYEHTVNIETLIDDLELRPYLQHRIGTLSGGWRQRVSLALAIIHDPELIILDEPTVGLDPMARREFWTLVKKLKSEGKTVLFSTHYMEEAMALGDRVIMLCEGQKVFDGTTQIIKDKALEFDHDLNGVFEFFVNQDRSK